MTLHVYDAVLQGSDEWKALRCGVVTASTVGKLVSVGPPAAQSVACPTCNARPENPCVSVARKTPAAIKSAHDARTAHAATRPPIYAVADDETSQGVTAILATERITGWTEDTPMSSDMFRGVEMEPFARDKYAEHYAEVAETGFMRRDEDGWTLGYSPDGLVGVDGLLEIKAPRAKNHLKTILTGEVPAQYMPQLQAGLLVSGRAWIDFCSFVAGMPLFVRRVTPDPAWFAAIEAACRQFEQNVRAIETDYWARVDGLPMTERINLEVVI